MYIYTGTKQTNTFTKQTTPSDSELIRAQNHHNVFTTLMMQEIPLLSVIQQIQWSKYFVTIMDNVTCRRVHASTQVRKYLFLVTLTQKLVTQSVW